MDDSEGVNVDGEIEVDPGGVAVTVGLAGLGEQAAVANNNNTIDIKAAIHRLRHDWVSILDS